jgi:hypothetical protein
MQNANTKSSNIQPLRGLQIQEFKYGYSTTQLSLSLFSISTSSFGQTKFNTVSNLTFSKTKRPFTNNFTNSNLSLRVYQSFVHLACKYSLLVISYN